jgi:para-aminobenzoate synthetase / 4-amino-4-deoxychorismate lyase
MAKKSGKLKDLWAGKRKGILLHGWPGTNSKNLFFINPSKEIICKDPARINTCLSLAQKFIDKGLFLAGYFSYELGHCLEKNAGRAFKPRLPLFYLAVFKKPAILKDLDRASRGAYGLSAIKPDTGKEEYAGKFNSIKKFIRDGEVYQVNECFKLKFDFSGHAGAFFKDLCSRQQAEYTAFLNDGRRRVLSISPELFFEIKGRNIEMRPMKGTVLKSPESGIRSPESELKNEKNRAENIMIVDLIRNDMGRICETGSVRAGPLFSIKEYDTLYQMTSTVKGRLKKGVNLMDILKALFPSGSVTGAPKIRAMQVIGGTEKSARGIYTGAIGFIGPKMKTACFNIPIRTIVIDKNGKAQMGVGSGIVHDSKMKAEYDECLGKTKFLHPSLRGNCLIESLLLKNGKYFLFELHIRRLMKSAAHFGVPVEKKQVIKLLESYALKLKKGSYKVRLLIDAGGRMKISGLPVIEDNTVEKRITVSRIKMRSNDIFLKHKTTHREIYDREYEKYRKKGFYDVVFFNERGELTEAHSSNVFIKKNGIYYTPAVSCGLLPGTYRDFLLAKGGKYGEKVLCKTDLLKADTIHICNSVRGIRQVFL